MEGFRADTPLANTPGYAGVSPAKEGAKRP